MMNLTPNNLLITKFLALISLVFSLGSCGLKYTPQTPPENKQLQRQKVIENKIRTDFEAKQMTYRSIAFGKTVTIKPASFIKLDSLFERKYNLEQTGRRSKELDEQIAIQRLVCQNDTNIILYMEEHVFSLTKDSVSEVFSGDFALNSRNEIQKVEFKQSYMIPADLVSFYGYYVLNESFLYPNSQLDRDEQNFYDLYKGQAANLFGAQKEAFIVHTLKLMQIANSAKSLEKQMFLKRLAQKEVGIKFFKEESFPRIDQVSKENGEVDYYIVDYMVSPKSGDNVLPKERYTLKFDPFLMFISKEKLY